MNLSFVKTISLSETLLLPIQGWGGSWVGLGEFQQDRILDFHHVWVRVASDTYVIFLGLGGIGIQRL